MNRKEQVADILLTIGAVFLSPQKPFTWASGIKSPIYCDNRLILAHPAERKAVETAMAEVIRESYPEAEVLMGTATAGIPHASIVAEILSMPMGYVRGGAKTHGRNNQIEGASVNGKKVVVVEDLISTAGSSIEVVEALREEGAEVLGIVSIFTYNLKKGIEKLASANVKNVSLSDISALTSVAIKKGIISEKEKLMVEKFISNPQDGSWQE
ncbi:MAG: orotate phosphoribosyltransferase [Firmicutes bacterium]|nr:orotate phosphoribosyltransferase [Bacillota bacterium]